MRYDRLFLGKDIISIIVALGVAGIILMVAIETAGVAGAAAVVVALAALGGPLGMMGGIAVLGLIVLINKKFAEMGFDALFEKALKGLRDSGKTKEQVFEEIDTYAIPDNLKRAVRGWVEGSWVNK